jgi:hypothetical protein
MAETEREAESQEITCPSCHGEEFSVINSKVGLLRCDFCQNLWIDSRFIKLQTEVLTREYSKKTLLGNEQVKVQVESSPQKTVANQQDLDESFAELDAKIDELDLGLHGSPDSSSLPSPTQLSAQLSSFSPRKLGQGFLEAIRISRGWTIGIIAVIVFLILSCYVSVHVDWYALTDGRGFIWE